MLYLIQDMTYEVNAILLINASKTVEAMHLLDGLTAPVHHRYTANPLGIQKQTFCTPTKTNELSFGYLNEDLRDERGSTHVLVAIQ